MLNTQRTFTIQKGPGSSGWNYQVGKFTDKLNEIADGFLKAGKTHYPNGNKIEKYEYARVAVDLGRYCRAYGAQNVEQRICALAELYQLCEKSDIGFTKKYWWTMGYGKKK